MPINDLMELSATALGFLIFALLERRLPARRYPPKKNELWLDLLSFAVLVASQKAMRVLWAGAFSPLQARFGIFPESIRSIPFPVRFVLTFFVMDFMLYWIHRGFHEIPGAWPIHAWHHSATQLGFFNGFRASFFHVFAMGFCQVLLPAYLFRFTPEELGWAAMTAVLLQLVAHANVDFERLRLPRIVLLVFTTSYNHRLHHATARAQQDSNYGNVTTLWDRLFGTFTDPRAVGDAFPLASIAAAAKRARPDRRVTRGGGRVAAASSPPMLHGTDLK